MKAMLAGHFPATRHDGLALDPERAKQIHVPLGFCGGLQQARGDWMWYQQVFAFPHWNAERICWKCGASSSGICNYKNFSKDAPWRTTRKTALQFMREVVKGGKNISPLFDSPGFTVDMVVIGVLHCVDLGVTAEVVGNIFWEYLQKMTRNKLEIRVQKLWIRLKDWYKINHAPSRLQGLTKDMIKKQKSKLAPKFKGKGAETRYLAPFCLDLAWEMNEKFQTEHTHLVFMMIQALNEFYIILMDGELWNQPDAAMTCQLFLELYKSLHLEARQKKVKMWAIKPKFHLFQELVQYQALEHGNPRGFWEYKDEDFVGWVAKLATRRGGANTNRVLVDKVLQRWRILFGQREV
jgi:hypothetical protein